MQLLPKSRATARCAGNHFRRRDLVGVTSSYCHGPLAIDAPTELAMNHLIADIIEPIDGKTSRAICDAVGDRLQRDFRPEAIRSSAHLERLLDELRRREQQEDAERPHRLG
jgi:hypothetical protein